MKQKPSAPKSFKQVRELISSKIEDLQARNRQWWESLPMTYDDWDNEQRMPTGKDDFLKIERQFLEGNLWLNRNFDFNAFSGKRVLEIGCGTGVASCLFAKGGASVTAIDITQKAVEMAMYNASLQGLQINVEMQDAESLQFPDSSFDYVFAWGVLHHTTNPERAFQQVYRVLKPGGRALIMVYNRNSFRYYVKGLLWLIVKGKILHGYGLDDVQSFYTDGYYHKHFTSNELCEKLKSTGFAISRVAVTHMSRRILPIFPIRIENWVKNKWGWLLVVEVEKS